MSKHFSGSRLRIRNDVIIRQCRLDNKSNVNRLLSGYIGCPRTEPCTKFSNRHNKFVEYIDHNKVVACTITYQTFCSYTALWNFSAKIQKKISVWKRLGCFSSYLPRVRWNGYSLKPRPRPTEPDFRQLYLPLYGASPVIWDLTVLPATRHKWVPPALKAGTRFTYPGGMEGWVDLGRNS